MTEYGEALREQRRVISSLPAFALESWIRSIDNLLVETQQQLLKSPHIPVRAQLAKHPSLDPGVADMLIEDVHEKVRRSLAACPGITEKVAAALLERAVPKTLEVLATNPGLPPRVKQSILEELEAGCSELFTGMCKRSDLDAQEFSMLEREARRRKAFIHLAGSPSATDDFFRRRITKASWGEKEKFASNPNAPDWLLCQLIGEGGAVAAIISFTPNLDASVVSEFFKGPIMVQVGTNLATRQKLTETQMRQLASLGGNVKAAVAIRADLPLDLIEKFALGDDYVTRQQVMMNPSLPVELMRQVANSEDASARMRTALAANPKLPVDIQITLIEQGSPQLIKALKKNEAYAPNGDFALKGLLALPLDPKSQRAIEEAKISPDAWKALAKGWTGTLKELKIADDSFQ